MSEIIALPKLNHPELNVFFENDLNIPRELVEPIFELPRETVVADLKTIWQHAITNSEAYWNQEWDMKSHEFVRHITWLACDLKATELLPELLDFLRLDTTSVDFWIGDSITEDFNEVSFHLVQDDLVLVKKFVFEEGIDEFHKWSAIKGVGMIAIYLPERRAEIIEWLSDIMDEILKDPKKYNNDYGWEIVTPIISEIDSIKGLELLDKAKKFFELELVDLSFYENWKDFEKRVPLNEEIFNQGIHNNIFERYENAVKNWFYYREIYDEEYIRAEARRQKKYEEEERKRLLKRSRTFHNSATPFVRKEPKVGRNEPCPCGSGKKFKKCCLNK